MRKKILYIIAIAVLVPAVLGFLVSCAPPSLRQTISDIVNMTVYLTSPENEGRVAAKTPLLNWEDAWEATGYELQIADAEDQLEGSTVIKLTKSEYEMPGMTLGDQKFWRVRAVKEGEAESGPWSETRSFEIGVSSQPKLIAQLGTSDGLSSSSGGMKILGNYVYLQQYGSGNALAIIDISNPTAPSFKSTFPYGINWGTDINGNILYCFNSSSSPGGIVQVDISDPLTPVALNSGSPVFSVMYNGDSYYITMATYISLSGTTLYVNGGDWDSSDHKPKGVLSIDFSNPAAPSVDGFAFDTGDNLPFASVKGATTTLYVTVNEKSNDDGSTITKGGLRSFSLISNDTGSYDIDSMDSGYLTISGNYAYVSSIKGPLTILDISNPYDIKYVATYDPGEFTGPSVVSGHYLFLTLSGSSTFRILDVSDPSAPAVVSSGDSNGAIGAVIGNYGYCGDFANGNFYVYDLVPGD